jgi:hypothetical protein
MDTLPLIIIIIAAFLVLGFGGGALFDFFERKTNRTEPDPGDLQAGTLRGTQTYTYLYPTGREVFFPRASHAKPVYEITFTGLLHGNNGQFADARYKTDECGNFTWHIDWLRVNGQKLTSSMSELVDEERFEHRYTFHIDGSGRRLTLALEKHESWSGALLATVQVLPSETPSIADVRAAQSARLEAKWEEDKISAKFAEQIQALCVRSQAFRNWADPDYRRKFAEVHADELIRNQSEIRDEATKFLGQTHIVGYLRRHHPDVVERFLGRLEALLMAERIVLDKRLGATQTQSPPAPPRKKLTAEEVRALKVHRQQVAIQDKVALKLDKIETRLNIRDRLEQMPLDQDERELIENELIGEIEEGDETHENVRTI